ncbi:MAG: DEAD/DEAH box helicase [Bdellovibrio sp.]
MFNKQFLDIPKNCSLESISLYLDDQSLLNGKALDHYFNADLSKYHVYELRKEDELLSSLLWEMPEVFRKKMVAFSDFYFNEVNEQNRLAGIVRYNFSNGMQVSAKEILRHPLHRSVPKDLLPQSKIQTPVFGRWPLIQQKESVFVSQNLREVEEIVQALLSTVLTQLRQKRLKVYLQCKNHSKEAIQINDIEFDPAMEMDWRVDFAEKKTLEAEFKLICTHKKNFQFFETFALEPQEGTLLVFPWYQEWKRLEAILSQISGETVRWRNTEGQIPVVETEGEIEAKAVLKYLRSRPIPVKVTGNNKTLEPQKSQTVIQLNESSAFYIEHHARAVGFKDLKHKGWTSRSVLYLTALSQGLPFLLNSDAKDIATKARRNRDWDLKLLRHLGIFQYLTLEILSHHFEGTLTDGRVVDQEHLFSLLHSKIHSLLVSGSGEILARETPLHELCSKSVLSQYNDYVNKTLDAMKGSESFFSEQGELVLEGVVEREFRLIYEVLKKWAVTTNGEVFRKSRTSLLDKMWSVSLDQDPCLEKGLFTIPASKPEAQIHETLETLQALIPYGFQIYYKGQPLQELQDEDFQVDFALQSDGTQGDFNWFELNPRFFLKGQEIDPSNMANFGSAGVIEYDGKLFLVPRKQMPSLRRLENFWMKLQKSKKDSSKRGAADKIYHLPRHQVLELLALRASGYGVRGDQEWKKLCEFYDNLGSENREFKLPKTIKAELKPYQTRGVQWLQDLYNLKLGALLADDMGLGKTLQTLTFLEDLRLKKQLGQVLVVVPSSLIFNWKSEIEKFTPKLPMAVFSSRDLNTIGKKLESKEDIVVITTYGLLMEHEAFLNQYHWKVLIFDEAQNLKNITTKRASSARSLKAQFKICLTGTPMENHYGEFYSLMDLLVPGSLGKIEDFRRQYVNTDMILREEIEDLKLKIRPLMMRRTKKEILDQLPEKQETKINIAFEERQKEIYRDIALSYNQRVQESLLSQGEASVQLQMLTALLRLRQACSDPAALPNVRYDKVPPKLEALLDSLTEIVESGESALVFTQFIQTLEHTAKILKEKNIPVFVLHGGIPTKQRQKILEDFNNTQGGAVLVMTLKTGGVGLNLTKASYVFHLEPWWNPSVENQATDRAHRLGQNRAVQVFRYIMHESLEEKIELLKNRKDKKFQSLFATPEKESELGPGTGALSKADFDFLLGIK